MNSYVRKAKLPPGSLVYTGQGTNDSKALISVFVYNEAHLEEKDITTLPEALALRRPDCITWINITGLADTGTIAEIGRHFDIHALVLEDILHVAQRPKCEDYGDYLFVVARMLDSTARPGRTPEISGEQVSCILGKDYLITFQERPGDVFDAVRNRLRQSKGQVRQMGPDYLAYALLDAIVDNYFVILERIGEDSEAIEEALVENPSEAMMHRIHAMKRLMITLRRAIWPLREAVGILERGDTPLITKRSRIYYRDLYDHTIQVMDVVESLRDVAGGMLDTYLSALSNRMNNVMKVLTIIATIFIPLTFIAGIYGMNFEYMPELQQPWAYPATLLVMLATAAVMLLFFRRKHWL
jgi:magnesium transporter